MTKDEALLRAIIALENANSKLVQHNNECLLIQSISIAIKACEKALVQLKATVQNNQTPRDDWEGFESPWESKIPTVKDYLTVQKPLSEESIMFMYNMPHSDAEMIAFARAIEKAHGIGE